eukprot:TRINITY_DN262_c0_g1_i12.p1 TRINITY_DN262_c0_g1~~TRINITY_DN262_c0_g1_i12.p1  ORF type:complete len:737 (+),score=152.34 TRINITY_DN262_c0_g1_i12:31-2241(+)
MASCGGNGPIRVLLDRRRLSAQSDACDDATFDALPFDAQQKSPHVALNREKRKKKKTKNDKVEAPPLDAHAEALRKMDALVKRTTIIVNVTECKWRVVKSCVKKRGWKCVQGDDAGEWDVYWSDTESQNIRIFGHQKINHFPGMYGLARKNFLSHNLSQMKRVFPSEYDFFPTTWVLPDGYESLRADMQRNKGRVYISKPDNSSQGKGIFLIRNMDSIPRDKRCVVQIYIDKPFLIDDLKFDMRIYVLVTSCIPLRVFLFDEGLGRFCTEPYEKPTDDNMADAYRHLTNYAINKQNDNFEPNTDPTVTDRGSKRSLKAVMDSVASAGHDVDLLWKDISDLIIKTLISVQPSLEVQYKSTFGPTNDGFSCFEILGFDVLLDSNLKPWLLEVNHAPSLRTDSPFDKVVKRALVKESLDILNIRVEDKIRFQRLRMNQIRSKSIGLPVAEDDSIPNVEPLTGPERERHEDTVMKHFRRIYPVSEASLHQKYEDCLAASKSLSNTLFSDTTASAARKQTIGAEKSSRDTLQTRPPKIPSGSNPPEAVKDLPSPQDSSLVKRHQSARGSRDERKETDMVKSAGKSKGSGSALSSSKSAPHLGAYERVPSTAKSTPPPPSPQSEAEFAPAADDLIFCRYEYLSAGSASDEDKVHERSNPYGSPTRTFDSPKQHSPWKKEHNIEISTLASAIKSAHMLVLEPPLLDLSSKKKRHYNPPFQIAAPKGSRVMGNAALDSDFGFLS